MSETTTMRLYALSIAAIQTVEGPSNIGIHVAIALLPDGISIHDAGLDVARDVFPEADGWVNHYATPVEIVQGFPLAPYRLIWHVESDGSAS